MDTETLPTIVFEQSWQGVEWAAKQRFNAHELSTQLAHIRKPDTMICDSLEKMHRAFYPNEAHKSAEEAREHIRTICAGSTSLRYEDYLPWVLHKALYAEKDENENILVQSYDEIIKKALEREWLLSWHWRAVLPSLREYNPNKGGKKLIVQISHVRKWEMLLCYTVNQALLRDHNTIGEIPLKDKNLLRAPLFGLSHRLKGRDTYRLFYQPEVKRYIETETADVAKLQTNKMLAEAYILGRHDCFYIVDKLEADGTKYTWTLRALIDAQPEKVLIDKEIFGDKLFHFRPTDLIDVPSFADGHPGIPQLLSSDNYCEAILELTEVLNDPTAKSVLLIAPPGSGKEKLAESAFYCRDQTYAGDDNTIPWKKVPGKFIAATLAGLSAEVAAKLLFHAGDDTLKLNDPKKPFADYLPDDHPKDGLILQAFGGALFIDEIDKTNKDIRDLLLRVLESDEITVPDSSQILKIPKERIPLYIFAGSMNRQSMFQESPPDFWTRISHVIEVAHPLGIDDLEKARKVVKDYLWMFWCIHVKDFMKKKGVQKPEGVADRIKPLNDFYISLYAFLLDKNTIDFATGILSEEVSGCGRPLVSIRTLRSIVARAVFKLVDVLLYSKFDNPIEIFKEQEKLKFAGKTPSEWFVALTNIIKNENGRKMSNLSELGKTVDCVELSVVESFRSAIRLGASLAQ